MASSVLQVQIDDNLKEQASAVYESLGIDLSAAVQIFLKQSVVDKEPSVPGMVVNHALNGEIKPLYSSDMMREYEDNLHRSKFDFSPDRVDKLLTGIKTRGILLDAAKIDMEFIDENDIVFYEVVMEKRMTDDAWLVTGNIRHFPKEPFIVTPREMLDIIERNGK